MFEFGADVGCRTPRAERSVLAAGQEGPDASDRVVVGEGRVRVLTVLEASGVALGVGEVAEQLGLHPNTARLHLDALAEAGLALQWVEHRGGPGRPRKLYTIAPGSTSADRRSYQLLAEILISYIAGRITEPGQAAEEAGDAWGRYLAGPTAPFETVGAEAAVWRLVDVLNAIGFGTEVVDTSHGRQVLLRNCPFRGLAVKHQAVVCSVHLGLMRGVLHELHAPLDVRPLEPLVTSSLCIAHLMDADDEIAGTG